MTYSQFYLYLEAMGQDQLRELRERAIAARAAGATQEGWEQFMDSVSGVDREAEAKRGMEELVEKVKNRKVKNLEDVKGVTWQKLS